MAYIAENPKYKISNSILSDEEYIVEINLQELRDNANKVVYDDGTCKIVIKSVEKLTDANGYGVFFDSVGEYSMQGAKLVSGIQYSCENTNFYTAKMNGKMEATYNNITYVPPVSGMTPLNYRNGDSFGFYIFPAGEDIKEILNVEKINCVTLTLKNLCVNVWNGV